MNGTAAATRQQISRKCKKKNYNTFSFFKNGIYRLAGRECFQCTCHSEPAPTRLCQLVRIFWRDSEQWRWTEPVLGHQLPE